MGAAAEQRETVLIRRITRRLTKDMGVVEGMLLIVIQILIELKYTKRKTLRPMKGMGVEEGMLLIVILALTKLKNTQRKALSKIGKIESMVLAGMILVKKE